MGFPCSSVGKESACNAGDPGLIPGLGRSPGEGKGYPLQYSWASLVAQLVKNLPAMWETWIRSLGWEDPLEKGKAIHSSNSGLENSMDCIVHGVAKSWTRLSDFCFHFESVGSHLHIHPHDYLYLYYLFFDAKIILHLPLRSLGSSWRDEVCSYLKIGNSRRQGRLSANVPHKLDFTGEENYWPCVGSWGRVVQGKR